MLKFLKKVILYLILITALVAAGYSWWMKSRLDARLAAEEVKEFSSSFSLVEPARTEVRSSLPRILRVAVKRKDVPNWLPCEGHGLVHGAYDWSPEGSEWVPVEPTAEARAEALQLRRLEVLTPGQHIDALTDDDSHVREAANALLVLRTSQDFGFRYDRTLESQREAIDKWKSWWADNKLSWTAGKFLDGVQEILKK